MNIAGNILVNVVEAPPEAELSNCINMAGDIIANANAEKDDKPSSNLLNIAGDILVNSAKDDKPSSNLLNIAGDILVNTVKDKDEEEENDSAPSNLIKITGDIFNITGRIEKLSQLIPKKTKKELSDKEKLEVIKSLTNVLLDMRVEPQFPIAWLLNYMDVLNKLKVESNVKSAFSRWAWSVISEMKGSSSDLVEVPPSSMVQLSNDVLNDNDWIKSDTNKVISDLFEALVYFIKSIFFKAY